MKLHLEKAVYKELKKERTLLDSLTIAVGIAGPLYALPQLYLVWTGPAEGVSLITWLGFLLTAVILLAYSVLYRLKPLIISNILWIIIEGGIIIGLLLKH